MAIQVFPYMHFIDNAGEAIEFYRSVFGADVDVHKFGEYGTPENDPSKELIMHCELNFAGAKFFISDSLPMGGVKQGGENIELSINGGKDDEEVLTGYFNGLAEGGNVKDSLSTKPWGATFGMLTDKYGINWMVNIEQA